MWLRDQALAASRGAIVITDPNEPDNPIVYANPTFERITGYSIEEAVGKNCRFLQGEDRDQPALEELRAAIREERECQVVLRNYKKDGILLWNELSISPVRDEEGNLVNFVGVLGDVSERKRTEEALQYQLGLTRTITNNAADSLFLWDTEGRVTFMNPAAEQTFGWSQEELLGEVLHDKMHHHYPDGRLYPISECPLVRVFESGQTLRDHEDLFFHRDGSAIDVACSHAPIVVDGRITGAALVVRDITERKKNEETQRFLAEAGASLSSSLDYRTTLARMARLAVPRLADWCVIDVTEEDGSIERLAVQHEDPQKLELAHKLQERYPPDPDLPQGVLRVVRSGQPEFHPEISDDMLVATARDAEHLRLMCEIGLTSVIIVPLVARGANAGSDNASISGVGATLRVRRSEASRRTRSSRRACRGQRTALPGPQRGCPYPPGGSPAPPLARDTRRRGGFALCLCWTGRCRR
jgi:PAS domain S-box-containing protein